MRESEAVSAASYLREVYGDEDDRVIRHSIVVDDKTLWEEWTDDNIECYWTGRDMRGEIDAECAKYGLKR